MLVETPHKELQPLELSGLKQFRFRNLFIKASPLPRLRSVCLLLGGGGGFGAGFWGASD